MKDFEDWWKRAQRGRGVLPLDEWVREAFEAGARSERRGQCLEGSRLAGGVPAWRPVSEPAQ